MHPTKSTRALWLWYKRELSSEFYLKMVNMFFSNTGRKSRGHIHKNPLIAPRAHSVYSIHRCVCVCVPCMLFVNKQRNFYKLICRASSYFNFTSQTHFRRSPISILSKEWGSVNSFNFRWRNKRIAVKFPN